VRCSRPTLLCRSLVAASSAQPARKLQKSQRRFLCAEWAGVLSLSPTTPLSRIGQAVQLAQSRARSAQLGTNRAHNMQQACSSSKKPHYGPQEKGAQAVHHPRRPFSLRLSRRAGGATQPRQGIPGIQVSLAATRMPTLQKTPPLRLVAPLSCERTLRPVVPGSACALSAQLTSDSQN